ncbi:MAG: hypothetical protein OSJ46_02035 [Duncaniella sp.]|nr:hypothetical protein [Duncaniella sp.]
MKNWNHFINGLLGAVVYIANSYLLPDWNHFLVGVFTAVTYVAAYWLMPKNLKIGIRALIPTALAIVAAATVRFVCF